jgi:hypothetical protein
MDCWRVIHLWEVMDMSRERNGMHEGYIPWYYGVMVIYGAFMGSR